MNKINDLERAKLREEMYYCEVARRLDMNSKARTINMIYKRGRNISLMTNSDLTQTHNYCEQIPAQARVLKIR